MSTPSRAVTPAEQAAMVRAVELANLAERTSPNPKVGCLVLDAAGQVVGEGHHPGAGQPHAEVFALRAAADSARGGTAVVTLEPCSHTGRTGPCTEALLAAGISRVVVGRRDPNPEAAGGVDQLRAAGVEVVEVDPSDGLWSLNSVWEQAVRLGRPVVWWKVAATMDGRVAASDATSRWITAAMARDQVHRLRAQVDAVAVGTGTVLADDPHLAARLATSPDTAGGTGARADNQPLRVVLGKRDIPGGSRVLDGAAQTVQLPQHDPVAVLDDLWHRGVRHLLLEGGPTVAAAFLRSGLVDRIIWYFAPQLLGSGPAAVSDLGITTMASAQQWRIVAHDLVGTDLRVDLEPTPPLQIGRAG